MSIGSGTNVDEIVTWSSGVRVMPGEHAVPLTYTTVPGGPDDGETPNDCTAAPATPRVARLATTITAIATTAPKVPRRRGPFAARAPLGSAACCPPVMRPPRHTTKTVTWRSAHFALRLKSCEVVVLLLMCRARPGRDPAVSR